MGGLIGIKTKRGGVGGGEGGGQEWGGDDEKTEVDCHMFQVKLRSSSKNWGKKGVQRSIFSSKFRREV